MSGLSILFIKVEEIVLLFRSFLLIRIAITTSSKIVEVKTSWLLLLFLLGLRLWLLCTCSASDIKIRDILKKIKIFIHLEFLSLVYLFRYILLLLLALNLFEHITIEIKFLNTLSFFVFFVCVLFTVHACTKL